MKTPRFRALSVSLWLVQGVLALLLAPTGVWKLATPAAELATKFPWMGQVSPAFLHLTAVADLLGGLGILLPSLTRIRPGLTVAAALGCAALMVSAILFHVSRGEAASTPFNFVVLGLSLFVAWGRGPWASVTTDARLRRQTDGRPEPLSAGRPLVDDRPQ